MKEMMPCMFDSDVDSANDDPRVLLPMVAADNTRQWYAHWWVLIKYHFMCH